MKRGSSAGAKAHLCLSLSELRSSPPLALARKNNVFFNVVEGEGKGSHYRVYYGSCKTTIQSGELDPKRAKRIKKQLGLE